MAAKPDKLPCGVTHEAYPGSNVYRGPADKLIALGIIRADQIPERSMVTFYKGHRVRKGDTTTPRDEHYLSVRRSGKHALSVWQGVSAEETARREALRKEQNPWPLPRPQSAPAPQQAAPAMKARGHLRLVHDADAKARQPQRASQQEPPHWEDFRELFVALTAIAGKGELTGMVSVYRRNGELRTLHVGDMKGRDQLDAALKELLHLSARSHLEAE